MSQPLTRHPFTNRTTRTAGVTLLAGSFLLTATTATGAAGPAASFGPNTDYPVGANPASVALSDVNKDGHLDIVTADKGDNTVSVLLGNGSGTFGTQTPFSTGVGAGPRSVALGDVNGDGNLDIVVGNDVIPGYAVVRLGRGDGTFRPQSQFSTGDDAKAVALGDVNADQHLDIVTANEADDTASVLLNTTLFDQTITFPQPPDASLTAGTVALSASSNSGLSITYESYTTSVCTINSTGTQVQLNAAGTCTIAANQAGNSGWSPAVAVVRTFQVTETPVTATTLTVKARAKSRALKPGTSTKVVRSASTNAEIRKARTTCYVNGKKLTGKDKRAACKVTVTKTTSNAKVWVVPKCSVGLKVRVKITANATGMDKATWKRTWRVKDDPKIYCPVNANG